MSQQHDRMVSGDEPLTGDVPEVTLASAREAGDSALGHAIARVTAEAKDPGAVAAAGWPNKVL